MVEKNRYVLKILLLFACIAVLVCVAGCADGERVFSCTLTDGAVVTTSN